MNPKDNYSKNYQQPTDTNRTQDNKEQTEPKLYDTRK